MKCMIIILLITILAVFPESSRADSVMEDIFTRSTTLQVNPATTINTPTRSGVTFGGASYRVKSVATPIATFEAPRASGGCAGVDFFAGSFSLINSDQLVQMGRAIAQGVPSYAFGLAMQSVCPSCAGLMQRLQGKLDEFNEMAANGCESAVAFLGKEYASEIDGFKANMEFSVLEGIADPDSGWLPDVGGAEAEKGSTDNLATKAAKNGVDIEMNVANASLTSSNIDNYTSPGLPGLSGVELKMVLMSLTGTLTLVNTGDTSDSASGMVTTPLKALFTIEDFIDGTPDGNISFYVCDENVRCLNPHVDIRTHKGLFESYKQTAQSGLLKIYGRGSSLNATERGVEQLSGLRLQGMVPNFKTGDIESAATIVAMRASMNVVDSLISSLHDLIPTITSSMNVENSFSTGIVSAYKDRLVKLSEDLKEYKRIRADRMMTKIAIDKAVEGLK